MKTLARVAQLRDEGPIEGALGDRHASRRQSRRPRGRGHGANASAAKNRCPGAKQLRSGTMAARKRKKTTPDAPDGGVVRFPPVPRVPPPPLLSEDPRQVTAARIIGAVAKVAQTSMEVGGPNLVKGFHASAVDLGRLQQALERGLSRFDYAQIEARWSEVFDWIRRVVGAWVQRYKHMKIERFERGIRIELETQDDHGYYHYTFDVFPHRGRPARRP